VRTILDISERGACHTFVQIAAWSGTLAAGQTIWRCASGSRSLLRSGVGSVFAG
jgi:hypothetical protein